LNTSIDPPRTSNSGAGEPDRGEGSGRVRRPDQIERPGRGRVLVRPTSPGDVPHLLQLSRSIYGEEGSWKARELLLHQEVFPEGQMVAVGARSGRILGMVVSLVVPIRQWPVDAPWREITDHGRLTTHDPQGDTLYGAGIAVRRDTRGMGVGSALYRAREELLLRLGLERIRAGARISGYREVANRISAQDYVDQVLRGERSDPTLSFQLAQGFQVLTVASDYLPTDEASLGHAAVVEWAPSPEGLSSPEALPSSPASDSPG
jgi:ribosomal protein S18 acetylase RimI-like enzyme